MKAQLTLPSLERLHRGTPMLTDNLALFRASRRKRRRPRRPLFARLLAIRRRHP